MTWNIREMIAETRSYIFNDILAVVDVLEGLCHGTSAVSSSKLTNKIPCCLYLWVIYVFEHEKKICDKCLQKDLANVDSGPETRSV